MNDQPTTDSGCFARGCLIVVIACVALVLVFGAGGYFLYRKAVSRFTAESAVEVQLTPPTPVELQFAHANLDRLRSAIANDRSETIVFSATDLNALVAQDREFSGAHGRVGFAMADSVMTLDLSVPVDSLPLLGLQSRWFNGSARFTGSYEFDQFEFSILSLRTGQWEIPGWLFSPEFCASFSRSFSRRFHETMQRNAQGGAAWGHIRSVKLDGDKLVVTTQP